MWTNNDKHSIPINHFSQVFKDLYYKFYVHVHSAVYYNNNIIIQIEDHVCYYMNTTSHQSYICVCARVNSTYNSYLN